MPRRVVVTSARRTAIGRFLGAFSEMSAADLGTALVKDLLSNAGLEGAQVDEVILGCARQAGGGPNVARQVSFRAGCPDTVPAFTVNKACGSGLKAIVLATQSILLGDADCIVAGGVESMSRVPFLLPRARQGYRLGHAEMVDGMYQDGFVCPLCKDVMGKTAETLAEEYKIPRDKQDLYALHSQQRAEAAIKAGHFAAEIAPVEVIEGKGTKVIAQDEHVRLGATIESIQKLPPVFKEGGSVTAANSSGITDGAAALVLMSEERAKALGKEPLAFVEGYVSAGVPPRVMGLGPVPAVRKLNARLGLSVKDYDLVELNEAFAAQVIACHQELGFEPERMNCFGSGISLGHPIGATGARISVTLLHAMKRMRVRRGLATLCISGGQGMAVSFVGA